MKQVFSWVQLLLNIEVTIAVVDGPGSRICHNTHGTNFPGVIKHKSYGGKESSIKVPESF